MKGVLGAIGGQGRRAIRAPMAAAVLLTVGLNRSYAAREMTTDRPDATESPFTVEPGRFQVEASAGSYLRDRKNPEHDDTRVESWNIAPFNLRVGLTPVWEVQFVVDNFVEGTVDDPASGLHKRQRGFGDVTLRVKRNLWGNDGGTTAFGIMPFFKFPTASGGLGNDSVEGGLILALAVDLAPGWGLGAMTEFDGVRNDADDGYDAVWVNTVTIGRDLTEKLGAFFELTWETGPGKPAVSFNTGATFALNDDLQFDAGMNLGVTRAAPDLGVFVGVSQRF